MLHARMAEFGISTLIHYPQPPHLQAAFSRLGLAQGTFPVAEKLSKEILSLPIYPGIRSETSIKVAQVIGKFLRSSS
jgi:dTDP-4-amino-4,6-dideoxygalactose transaminase